MTVTDTHSSFQGFPPVRRLELDRPWAWLAAGWADIKRAPGVSLTYGAIFTAISFAITAGVFFAGMEYLLFPLAAGFMLVGPMMAVGLYETSRRLETGQPVSLGSALFVATRSPMRLAFVGVTLMALLLIWMRAATLLLALFLGPAEFPPLADIVPTLLFTPEGLALLIVGTGAGAILAAAVFAISVISVPLLMDRDLDFATAVFTSLQAVARNPKPMLLWAWLVAMLTAIGLVTLYFGLILTFPLVGHATWHAYRETVGS
ncbi:MAG: DUF2189 domain-containing protein [Kiloniellaceae bacterium]